SITFDDKPIGWTHPEGWSTTRTKGLRYATVHTGEKGKDLDISVFRFQPSSLKDNLDLWRKEDLGRPPIKEADIPKVTQKFKTKAGTEGTLVDMVGPGKGARRPGHLPGGSKRPRPLPISYTVPKGWTETGPRVSERRGIAVRIFTAFFVDKDK